VLAVARAHHYLDENTLGEVEKFLHHPAEWSKAHGGVAEFKPAG
jgi:orotate phosphoribosyltransferase